MSNLEVLFQKFVAKTLTKNEEEEFFALLAGKTNDQVLLSLIEEAMLNETEEKQLSGEKAEQILSLILQTGQKQKKIVRLGPLFRWVAAAVFLLVIGRLAWMNGTGGSREQHSVAIHTQKDILPARTGALLTLGDGRTVALDSISSGVIANQKGTIVTLKGNHLLYDGRQADQVTYNTLTTPRGYIFHLVLPDGSKVWLNAESSVKYPTGFTGKERVVELSGEAYFDVVRNEKMPFRVKLGDRTEIEVLGTSFNINAYENEAAVRTTLLQGKVKVSTPAAGNSQQIRVLHPGQQSLITNDGLDIQVRQVDTTAVVSWMNGVFNFENAGIDKIMRELERWYNINVSYENGIPPIQFGGKMGRNLTLQQVLRILEISKVHYRIENDRHLVITP